MPLTIYHQLVSSYTKRYDELQNRLRMLGFTRLLIFIVAVVFGYLHFVLHGPFWLIIALVFLGLFFYCIRLYQRVKEKAEIMGSLVSINNKEIDILKGQLSPYPAGSEFIDPHHPYSYDLDVFGNGSLFGFLNRTTTAYGKENLASALLNPDTRVISERQDAIRELMNRTDFRQHVQALGSLHSIKKEDMEKVKAFLLFPRIFNNQAGYYSIVVVPVATITTLVIYFTTGNAELLTIFSGLFFLNFFISSLFLKRIMKQVAVSTAVSKVLEQFGNQLKDIEKEPFASSHLKKLQGRLKNNGLMASDSIRRLAALFKYLDFIINPVMSAILNGLLLFHIHVLFVLDKWKIKNGNEVMNWLNTVGEFEALNSFGNFSFNNPGYCYPELVEEQILEAESLAHPLLRNKKGISNDISFRHEKFIVLTGSNMSGKSTFLRTIGINLVLARAGSAVCAKSFRLFPFDLYVSMRISDSLQDSESFFYAELKRLREIIQHLEEKNETFVMLDEILRGTNSNDKHSGTIGLIRKLVQHHACGIIATHDLTVADLSAEYPGYMGNNCFESEIVNGELVFDYKLKEGVCTRLNASFLMKKMGVID